MVAISSSVTFLPIEYLRRSKRQVTVSPLAVVVSAMSRTTV
jgi:hypothetical protein